MTSASDEPRAPVDGEFQHLPYVQDHKSHAAPGADTGRYRTEAVANDQSNFAVPATCAASGNAPSPPSDNDERPVRKQLKETSIDPSNKMSSSGDTSSVASAPEQGSGRKRSFEEVRGDTDDVIENGDGRRKRSRECTPVEIAKEESLVVSATDNIVEVPEVTVISDSDSDFESGEEAQASIAARVRQASFDCVHASVPRALLDAEKRATTDATNDDAAKALKKKRSLEQLEEEGAQKSEEVEKKRHRDNSQERETQTNKAFAQSAFANMAAASPFASLGGSSSTTEKPTSTSAFASSALSSFAGSESSPFGTLGAITPSVFKSSGSSKTGFGSSGPSGFGSLTSGFAGVGGGFAAAGKSGGLTNFASPNAPATFGGESKSKAIGAEESDDEGSDSDGGEENSTFEADKTDERFYEQTIETGEEEEETIFACKGKLFHFTSGEWKERGVGTFKVNARKNDADKQTGRMIMRADGALRVMLNSPVFQGMTFGDAKNEEPTTKQILLASSEEGRTVPLLLRVGNEALAKDLYGVIKDLLNDE
ncbi:uncharacterized protein N7482_001914 [Penicillium canariense]|uniref:RanBD1 domain-containing protein n=1 Tax=Penicillium canariense TaxID=189055 RepID=A0A9W9IGP2_9EURO|nr:uncharacterized protein N7482_001914 [Penicillium canariense]KAJ5176037.1 hypothetical protein N7482_001914 [Penicillium canariense]